MENNNTKIQSIATGLLLGGVMLYTSACGTYQVTYKSVFDDANYYSEFGDAEAIHAKSAERNGLITNGKATADNDTSYWALLRARSAKSISEFKKILADKPKIQNRQE